MKDLILSYKEEQDFYEKQQELILRGFKWLDGNTFQKFRDSIMGIKLSCFRLEDSGTITMAVKAHFKDVEEIQLEDLKEANDFKDLFKKKNNTLDTAFDGEAVFEIKKHRPEKYDTVLLNGGKYSRRQIKMIFNHFKKLRNE